MGIARVFSLCVYQGSGTIIEHKRSAKKSRRYKQAEITRLAQSVNELKEHMKNLTRIILNGRSDLVRRADIL